VHVDHQPPLVGQRREEPHRGDAVLAGEPVVRNATDHVDAEVDGLLPQLRAVGKAENAQLRKGDQPQVDVTSAVVRSPALSARTAMPSNSEPLTFGRCCPTVLVLRGRTASPAAGRSCVAAFHPDCQAGQVRADDEREAEHGGDPACWLPRVCPACGRLADEDPPTTCAACGAELTGD
jgi:hypothetical protein